MAETPDTPHEVKPHYHQEYEDPHYHDEDEMAPVEDGEQHVARPAASTSRKSIRRPPPPRRFYED
jgi:hypothetical protein